MRTGAALLKGTEQPGGQGQYGAQQIEDAVDGDAEEAEGEREEPDYRVENEGQHGKRPAEDEEDDEEQ